MNLKNKIGVAIALVASQGAIAEIQPQAMDMGPVKFVPTLGVSHTYDDNIFNQATNEEGSSITHLKPKLQFVAEDEGSSYAATYSADVGRYNNSSDDDYVDHGLSLDAVMDLGIRNNLTLAASIDSLHDARGTGSSEGDGESRTKPDEYVLTGTSGTWEFGADGAMFGASLNAGYADIDYKNNKQDTSFRNRDEQKVGVRFYGRFQPKTRYFVEYETVDITYDQDPLPTATLLPNGGLLIEPGLSLDSVQDSVSVGLVWDITGKTTGTVKVGQTDKDFRAAGREDGDVNSWSAEVVWSPRTYSTVLLSSARAPQETNGTGSFIDNRTTELTWNHDWSSMWHTSFNISTGKDTFDGSVRSDDLFAYTMGINYDFDRWMNVGASYSYENKNSSETTFDYTRRVLAVTMNVSL